MRKGVPVSPGVAVARAFCVDEVLVRREPQHLDVTAVSAELGRLDAACGLAATELEEMAAKLTREIGEDKAAIFRAHRQMVRDPAFLGKVKSIVLDRKVDSHTALHEVLEEYTALFSKIEDEYLKERIADIRDVVGRIQRHLSQDLKADPPQMDTPVILVAPEILPSQAFSLERLSIAGILTETGGNSGHAAILARSLGIPAVSGLHGLLHEVQTGDLIAVDGREGHVHLRPGPEVEAAYRKLQREYGDIVGRLIDNRDQEPISRDGVAVELLANVNTPADAAAAKHVGAGGVGLYRTEYLFLTHPSLPTEEEQLATYRKVVEAAPNQAVTIRTLDLGGDKQLPFLGLNREANPFMGWRSIRMTSAFPELFQTQIRAILRAGAYGKVSLLLPMISTLEEAQRLERVIDRVKASLRRQGVPFAEHIPLGVMLEVPSAALCIDDLLDVADFVSIGSNDLIQYVMAADRDNPKVAHLCEPFHPAIMRLLDQIIKACNARGKPVTLCGEMAGRPRCFLTLFGMGLRRFSMSPAFLPPLKELIRCTTLAEAREIAERVIHMKTAGEVRGYLTRRVKQICPTVELLDVSK